MKRSLVFILIALLAGCATVSVKKFYKDVKYPATNQADIVVFQEKPADKIFSELGEITVTGANDWDQVERIFRNKAAEMGADAVYVLSRKEETREYADPADCLVYDGYYYPYHHFGWERYQRDYFYPRGYFYCYGYQSRLETATFISAVGITIKYTDNGVKK